MEFFRIPLSSASLTKFWTEKWENTKECVNFVLYFILLHMSLVFFKFSGRNLVGETDGNRILQEFHSQINASGRFATHFLINVTRILLTLVEFSYFSRSEFMKNSFTQIIWTIFLCHGVWPHTFLVKVSKSQKKFSWNSIAQKMNEILDNILP